MTLTPCFSLLLPGDQTALILSKAHKACCPFAEVGTALHPEFPADFPSPKVGSHLTVPRPNLLSGLQQETMGCAEGFLRRGVVKRTSVEMTAESRGQERRVRCQRSENHGKPLPLWGPARPGRKDVRAVTKPRERQPTTVPCQGREGPRSAYMLISLFSRFCLLAVSPFDQLQREARGSLGDEGHRVSLPGHRAGKE